MRLHDKKIVVTGGTGFLGSYVVKELLKNGVPQKNISIPRSQTTDLRLKETCEKIVRGKDVIIHLAGNVGGIGKNLKYPGELFYDNILMGVHIIHAAKQAKVQKIVILGTICSYPKYTPVPFSEENLWMGYPEETNAPYGLAKKALLVQAQAYRQQYGLHTIYLLPVNLYGPGDNFDPDSSHVIPALIRKVHDANQKKQKYIHVWGDGSPTREFLYVEDAARAIILATKKYDKKEPVNIGSGEEIAIKSLVSLIAQCMNFTGKIIWDKDKPNGQPRRLLNTDRAKKEFGFVAKTSFSKGLKKTIDWYLKSQTM